MRDRAVTAPYDYINRLTVEDPFCFIGRYEVLISAEGRICGSLEIVYDVKVRVPGKLRRDLEVKLDRVNDRLGDVSENVLVRR